MSGKLTKLKQRQGANSVENLGLSLNERILKECYLLYADENKGLIGIAESLGLKLLAPRKKINVMLLGNHSAGKSSFINWYIEEHIQKTGVAIETQGFAFVTSGRKRETLTGNATIHLYPHFQGLAEIPGVLDYVTTEISTSKQKKFGLVTFIDTPGLVDGDTKYPFDVNKGILWLGDLADCIFVFFDPIGQALCKRTLNIVEALNERHSDRIKFFLSKADEAGQESDRQRVLMQIVQELCKRPGLNKCGFDMPTVFIPPLQNKNSRCANQIHEVCDQIEKTINHTIQNSLNSLEKDCEQISSVIDQKLENDRLAQSHNLRARGKSCIFASCGLFLPLVFLLNIFVGSLSHDFLSNDWMILLYTYLTPFRNLWASVPADWQEEALSIILVTSIILLLLARFAGRLKASLSRRQKHILLEQQDYVLHHVKAKKKKLYEEYLQQSINASDL